MKKCFVFMTLFLGGITSGRATTTPSSLIVKVFEMRVSKNSDCSSGIVVFKYAGPVAVDLFGNPTLGSGATPDGTYHCVMLHISDRVTVTAPEGSCSAGPTVDIFSTTDNKSTTPEGVVITGSAADDEPWIYLSDSAAASNLNNCFEPGAGPDQCACSGPCPMKVPLTLTGDQTHTLVFNLANKVDGLSNPGTCALLLPDGDSIRQTGLSIR